VFSASSEARDRNAPINANQIRLQTSRIRQEHRPIRWQLPARLSFRQGHAVDVIDDIAPRPDEPVVRGQAANGFDGTALDTILRVAGVDTLVLVGIATDVAVESTARAASDRQYRTIVVSDACQADSDEAHARALDVLQKWFSETPTADEVLSAVRIATQEGSE
jgi:nicotinamidase-related amidase